MRARGSADDWRSLDAYTSIRTRTRTRTRHAITLCASRAVMNRRLNLFPKIYRTSARLPEPPFGPQFTRHVGHSVCSHRSGRFSWHKQMNYACVFHSNDESDTSSAVCNESARIPKSDRKKRNKLNAVVWPSWELSQNVGKQKNRTQDEHEDYKASMRLCWMASCHPLHVSPQTHTSRKRAHHEIDVEVFATRRSIFIQNCLSL